MVARGCFKTRTTSCAGSAGKFMPEVLGGAGGMVLITDGGPGFALHAYVALVTAPLHSKSKQRRECEPVTVLYPHLLLWGE